MFVSVNPKNYIFRNERKSLVKR